MAQCGNALGLFSYLGKTMLTTKDIINAMLVANGETPVTSPDSQHPSVLSALEVLNRINTEFQAQAWWFNTDYALELSPNEATGEVIVPSNTLMVELTSSLPYVWRGSKLYDPVKHTYNIGSKVTVNLVTKLDIEELPTVAALYVQAKAVQTHYIGDDGDMDKASKYEAETLKAWAMVQKDERRITKQNATNSPTAFAILSRIQLGGSSYNPNYPGGR